MTVWLNEQALRTHAVVATRHLQFGNGYELLDMSSEDQARLRNFIDSLPSESTVGV